MSNSNRERIQEIKNHPGTDGCGNCCSECHEHKEYLLSAMDEKDALLKQVVGALERLHNWFETLKAEQWEKTRHGIEKASENWDRIESAQFDMSFLKELLDLPALQQFRSQEEWTLGERGL